MLNPKCHHTNPRTPNVSTGKVDRVQNRSTDSLTPSHAAGTNLLKTPLTHTLTLAHTPSQSVTPSHSRLLTQRMCPLRH